MKPERTLVLVGPTGAGKSSVGRVLAARWRVPFVDVDAEIERHAGLSIGEIFARDGEAAFRELERETLRELLAGARCVLATGGGAVLDAASRRRMAEHGHVVHLHAGVDAQLRRLDGDRTRPLLAGPDRAAALRAMAGHRTPLYREIARFTVDTDALDADAVAERVDRRLDIEPSLEDSHA